MGLCDETLGPCAGTLGLSGTPVFPEVLFDLAGDTGGGLSATTGGLDTFGLCARGSGLELEKLLYTRGLLFSMLVLVVVAAVVVVLVIVLIVVEVVFVAAAGVVTTTPAVAARTLFMGVRLLCITLVCDGGRLEGCGR